MGLFRRAQAARPPATDPDLERLNRALEAIDAGPSGKEGAELKGDLDSLRAWMKARFDAGDYDAVWSRRAALGLSLTQQEASPETWFWVNALPALAALREGERHHPLIATAAGYAEQAHRSIDGPPDPAADSTMAEIKKRFFA
jgi:hypothetical protein